MEDDVTTDGGSPRTPGDAATDDAGGRPRVRRVAARVTTALACLLVLLALVTPDQVDRLTLGEFVRIPLEGLLGVTLVLVLPGRLRRVATVLAGVTLGLLTIVKIIDMGFYAALARPFDPVLDWALFDDGFGFLTDSIGRAGAVGAVVAAAVLAVALVVAVTWSVQRLTPIVVRHRPAATRAAAALIVVWVACAAFGVQILPGVPVAADSAAALAYDSARRVPAGLQDQQNFAAAAGVDAFHDTPGEDLLTGLRGKDVILSFVESYGRVAVQDPVLGPQVGAVLDAGNRRLAAAGFASRSAFLTSPTAGGGSWLAHSTFLSGLWIDNQQRYDNLLKSDRLTLTRAFRRANWRTVGVMPGATQPWPEGAFYGYDQIYAAKDLGYHGPKFSWAPMPDQYTLAQFERDEHGKPGHAPTMANVTLVSSHSPWAPIPRMIDWTDVGDGSVYDGIAAAGNSVDDVWRDPARVRTEYARSIEYSLDSLISYVERYGDDNLVLVFLGDHQPAPIVTGTGASRDVPITIVARDRTVLDRIAGWGWQDGLKPDPQAPVWRMDTFRDRFLTAFGR